MSLEKASGRALEVLTVTSFVLKIDVYEALFLYVAGHMIDNGSLFNILATVAQQHTVQTMC